MKTLAWLLIACCFSLSAQAAIYTWTDEKGNVVYSDQPHEGAKKVTLPPDQSFSKGRDKSATGAANATATPSSPSATAPLPTTKLKRQYKSISITSPTDGATLRNNSGDMTVTVSLDPALIKGDQIVVYLDGRAVGKPQTVPVFALTNVDRGEHKLKVEVIDSAGNKIGETEEITFFMHQAHLNPTGGITS